MSTAEQLFVESITGNRALHDQAKSLIDSNIKTVSDIKGLADTALADNKKAIEDLLHKAKKDISQEVGVISDSLNRFDYTIDLTELNPEYFYPVRLQGNALYPLNVTLSRAYWAERASGISRAGLFTNFIFVGATWGGNPTRYYVVHNDQTYIQTLGALTLAGYYHPMFFLKGGYLYNLITNLKTEVSIFSELTEYYKNTSEPKYNRWAGPIKLDVIKDKEHQFPMTSSFVQYTGKMLYQNPPIPFDGISDSI